MKSSLINRHTLIFLFLLAVLKFGALEGDSNFCAHFDTIPPSQGGSSLDITRHWGGDVQDDNLTIRCHINNYCFTLWTAHSGNRSKLNVVKQGCWIGEPNVCQQGTCVSNMAPKNNSHFCCCLGDMCNQNFTDGYDPVAHTTTFAFVPSRLHHDNNYKVKTVVISLVSVFSVALVISVGYLGYRMCLRPKHPSVESLHAPESPPARLELNMDDLKLCSIISKGRYAEVWKGKLDNEDVAVKIYSSHHRQYFNNEVTLYRYPFMDSDTLVKFYGVEERLNQEGSAQLMIIMSYMPLGSLNGYLKNNTLDWNTMVRMAYTVARALSHLHTDIRKGDQFKPVLAHRDINTRNILVKNDLTCVIADLGFAVATIGPKLIKKGHAEMAEQTSLTDVGTLRFMAPELLDGAVNLRDCEASLKQIDIYALGLVLWEVSSRCVDLYQGAPLPEYAPPFQAEVGSNPTFEDMQMAVARNKKRPRFPEVWKETNSAVRSLKETIEECWDTDAEARLTALCVEERLSELPHLWAHEIKHRGITPTLNAMININETASTTNTVQSSNAELPTQAATDVDETTVPLLGSTSEPALHPVEFSRSPTMSSTRTSLRDSISAGEVTGETLVSVTPVDGLPLPPKASNLTQAVNSTVLRPHTGRNPTVERNTHKRSSEELTLSGNLLVSAHFPEDLTNPRLRQDSLSTHSAPPHNHNAPVSSSSAESPLDYLSDGPETSLVQNDALSHRTAPIPFLQNQVHGHLPAGPPKVANTALRAYNNKGDRSLREKLSRMIRPKEIGQRLSGLSLFGGGKSRHDYSRADDLEDVPVDAADRSNVHGQQNGTVGGLGVSGSIVHSHHPSNLEHAQMRQRQSQNRDSLPQPIHTEVRFQNGSAVTRPTNLALAAHHASIRDHVPVNMNSAVELFPTHPSAAAIHRNSHSSLAQHELSDTQNPATASGQTLGLSQSSSTRGVNGVSEAFTGNSREGDMPLRNGISVTVLRERENKYPENRLRFAEVGVAKLLKPASQKQPVLHLQGQGHSKSTSQLLHSGQAHNIADSCWQEMELSASGETLASSQRRRPNSLSLKGHNYSTHAFIHSLSAKKAAVAASVADSSASGKVSYSASALAGRSHHKHSGPITYLREPGVHKSTAESLKEVTNQLFDPSGKLLKTHKRSTSVEGVGENSRRPVTSSLLMPDEASEKIRQRVQTPIRPSKQAAARLSLYDDRLMSGDPDIVDFEEAYRGSKKHPSPDADNLFSKDVTLNAKIAAHDNNNDQTGMDLNMCVSD